MRPRSPVVVLALAMVIGLTGAAPLVAQQVRRERERDLAVRATAGSAPNAVSARIDSRLQTRLDNRINRFYEPQPGTLSPLRITGVSKLSARTQRSR